MKYTYNSVCSILHVDCISHFVVLHAFAYIFSALPCGSHIDTYRLLAIDYDVIQANATTMS